MKRPLFYFLFSLFFCASAAAQNTQVTATFKTQEGKTPAQAGLSVKLCLLAGVLSGPTNGACTGGATAIYGDATFTAHDMGAYPNQVRELTIGGVPYYPGQVHVWIKADGTIISLDGSAGVRLLPTIGASPSGLAYCAEISFTGSAANRLSPVTLKGKNFCKAIPDQASVDWGTLAVASLVTPSYGYQTGLAGAVLNYENWACVTSATVPTPAAGFDNFFCDSADSNKLKRKISDGSVVVVEGGGGGSTTISIDAVNLSTQSPLNFQDTTEIDWTNPSAGNVQAALKAGSVADSKLATISTIDKVAPGAINDGGVAATQALFSGAAGAAGFRAIADADVPNNITIDQATLALTGDSATAFFAAGQIELARGGTAADLSATGGANQFVKQSSLGGAFTVGAIADADVPNTITIDQATLALTGDSATAFFAAGQIEAARGGTGDDTSGTTGVPRVTAGNWTYDAGSAQLADAANIALINAANVFTNTQSLDNQMELRLRELDANGDNYIGFKSIAARGADLTLEWAVTGDCSGTNGGVLTILGSQIVCQDDDGGAGGGGDNITVNTTAATDANFKDGTTSGNDIAVKFSLDTATTPDDITAKIVTTEIATVTFGANADFTWTFNNAGATDPQFQFVAGVLTLAAMTRLDTPNELRNANSAPLMLSGKDPNGATAIGVKLNNTAALSTAGAKLVSFQNNTVEKSFIDKDGGFSGNAATATALAVDPTTCSNQFVRDIAAAGTLTCNTVAKADAAATFVSNDQTNTYSTGTQDFESATVTRPYRRLAFVSFPGTCTANREFLERSDPATAGQVIYVCNAAGTGWDLVGDGGAGGGITTLNTLTAATQTFATPGTAGTAPAWTSATSTHTLDIPLAATASVTAGLISKTEYDAFNGKPALITAGTNGTEAVNAGDNTTAARSDHEHNTFLQLSWYFPGTPAAGVQTAVGVFPEGLAGIAITDMRITVNTTSASTSSVNIQRCTATCTGTTPTFAAIYSADLSLAANTRTVAKAAAPNQNVTSLVGGDQFKVQLVTVGASLADVTVTMTYKVKNTN